MRRYYKLLYIIIFVFLLSSLSSFHVLASVRVEPAKFIFKLQSGERGTVAIKVTNKIDQEIEIKAVLKDWTLNKNEELVIKEKGELKSTIDGLIKFNPRRFSLKPGQTQIVRFTVKLPKNENMERRGVVFFEKEQPAPENKTGAKVITQVGSTIYIRPEIIDLNKFKILGFKVHFPDEGLPVGLLAVENNCNAHLRYNIKYQLIKNNGEQITEGLVNKKHTLPGFKKGIVLPFKNKLSSGKYNLALDIMFVNENKKIKTTIPFEIK